ncbi:hypothetical protein ACQJBY_022597 [Aegilops geniculata]
MRLHRTGLGSTCLHAITCMCQPRPRIPLQPNSCHGQGKKLLSGFWWPGIIDMEMNNYALQLFFWKRQVAMLYFMSFVICILLSYCLLPLVNCASSMGVVEHVQKYVVRTQV